MVSAMTVVVTVDGALMVAPPPSGVSESPLAPGTHASQRTFAVVSSVASTHGPLSIAAVHAGGAASSPGGSVSSPASTSVPESMAAGGASSDDELHATNATATDAQEHAIAKRRSARREDMEAQCPPAPR